MRKCKKLPTLISSVFLIGMTVPAYGDDPLSPQELEEYITDNAQAIVDAGEDRTALQREIQQLKTTVEQLTQALEQSIALTKAYANTKASQAEQTAKAYAKAHANTKVIAYATGNGPWDDTDVGQIKSRVLRFTKAKTHTKIRINYTDSLSTAGNLKACRWEIRVDGSSCSNQTLVYDVYARPVHSLRSSTVVGYCSGVAAGSHTIGIWVSTTPGYSGSDCNTGWKNSTWVIEAEEVN